MDRFEGVVWTLMKFSPSIVLLAAMSAAAMVGLSGCEKKTSVKSVAQDTAAVAKDIATDVKDAAVSTWDTIKDYTFEKKSDFADGVDRLAARTDDGVDTLAAKSAPARDKAVEEYRAARATLKTQLGNLRDASADTWSATKEKTVEAWEGVQAAYEKVKKSATS